MSFRPLFVSLCAVLTGCLFSAFCEEPPKTPVSRETFLALLKNRPPQTDPVRYFSVVVTGSEAADLTQYIFACEQNDGNMTITLYKAAPLSEMTANAKPDQPTSLAAHLTRLFTIESNTATSQTTLYTDTGAFQCRYETRFVPWTHEWLLNTLEESKENELEINQAADGAFDVSIKRIFVFSKQVKGVIQLRIDPEMQLQTINVISKERRPSQDSQKGSEVVYRISISPVDGPERIQEIEKSLQERAQTDHAKTQPQQTPQTFYHLE